MNSYTHDELREMRERLEANLIQYEEKHPSLRPLPPMTEDDSKGMLMALIGAAMKRPLSEAESLLAGQLIAVYRMAIEARMLGKRGRYFVISEQDIANIKTDLESGRI